MPVMRVISSVMLSPGCTSWESVSTTLPFLSTSAAGLAAAHDCLMNDDACAPNFFDRRDDEQRVEDQPAAAEKVAPRHAAQPRRGAPSPSQT